MNDEFYKKVFTTALAKGEEGLEQIYDDECQCSCHDWGEEHSMCARDAKSCTYSRGGQVEEEEYSPNPNCKCHYCASGNYDAIPNFV